MSFLRYIGLIIVSVTLYNYVLEELKNRGINNNELQQHFDDILTIIKNTNQYANQYAHILTPIGFLLILLC